METKAQEHAKNAFKKYEGKMVGLVFEKDFKQDLEDAFLAGERAGYSKGMVDAHRKERIVPQQDNYERGLS
jgi:hypothetical protein